MEGAGWNSGSGCLPGTRKDLLEDAFAFINRPSDTAEIFKLTDVAGAGKSAFAHELAHQCHEKGILASSIFFARDVRERSVPDRVITTIARATCEKNPAYGDAVLAIVEAEAALASTFDMRQFEELVVKPSDCLPTDRPQVIIIDALDECADAARFLQLLQILRHGIPKLPSIFRIFVTSRATFETERQLAHQPHIYQQSFRIHEPSNLEDIRMYALARLTEVADANDMGPDWVTKMLPGFLRAAGGLFIWVEIVSRFLLDAIDPDTALADVGTESTPAEEQMDVLYGKILATQPWTDRSFVAGYHVVVGSIMVAKEPLSLAALMAFHPDASERQFTNILRKLRAVLSVPSERGKPIRILHQSFHDFITKRAGEHRFYICLTDHHQQMAISCLKILNKQLKEPIPGIGYLSREVSIPDSGIPTILDASISEELWYSCQFWTDHCLSMLDSQAISESVQEFIHENLLGWIEVCASKGSFSGVDTKFMGRLEVRQSV